jgi:hypothetical protein
VIVGSSSRDSPQAANPKAWTLEKGPGSWLSRKPDETKIVDFWHRESYNDFVYTVVAFFREYISC